MNNPITKHVSMTATLTIVAIVLTLAGPATASMKQSLLSAESKAAIEAIRKDSIEPAQFWVDEGVRQVVRARFNIWVPSRLSDDAAEAANWVVQRNRSLLRGVGLDDLSLPYMQGAVGDLDRVVYLQEYQGLPVEGAGVVVNMLDRGDHIEAVGMDNLAVPATIP